MTTIADFTIINNSSTIVTVYSFVFADQTGTHHHADLTLQGGGADETDNIVVVNSAVAPHRGQAFTTYYTTSTTSTGTYAGLIDVYAIYPDVSLTSASVVNSIFIGGAPPDPETPYYVVPGFDFGGGSAGDGGGSCDGGSCGP
jgi:hypothetical protein